MIQKGIKIARNFNYDSLEDDVERKINRERFFLYFKEENIKMAIIFENNCCNKMTEQLNLFLSWMHKNTKMRMTDMISFFDEDGFKMERILKFLSFENKEIVKSEIVDKFRLKKHKKQTENFVK